VLQPTPPLSAHEERALVRLAQQGNEHAATRLVTSQLRWLRAEANRRAGVAPRVERDDLVSAGVTELLEAIPAFDPSKGVRFWSFAHRGVALAMATEVAAYVGPYPVPDTTYRKVARAVRESGDDGEEAKRLALTLGGTTPDTFDAVRRARLWSSSEETAAQPGGLDKLEAASPLTWRPPRVEPDPVVRFVVRVALQALTSRERRVLALTVSEEPNSRLSDVAAAKVLDVSRSTVARDRRAALATLRELLGDDVREYLYPLRRPARRTADPVTLAA